MAHEAHTTVLCPGSSPCGLCSAQCWERPTPQNLPLQCPPAVTFSIQPQERGKKECARTWGWSAESQRGWGVAGTSADDRPRSSTCRTRERGGQEIRSVQLGIHAASALRIQRERRILFITLALRIGLLACDSIQKPDRWPSNGCLVHCVQPCP